MRITKLQYFPNARSVIRTLLFDTNIMGETPHWINMLGKPHTLGSVYNSTPPSVCENDIGPVPIEPLPGEIYQTEQQLKLR